MCVCIYICVCVCVKENVKRKKKNIGSNDKGIDKYVKYLFMKTESTIIQGSEKKKRYC